MPMKSNRLAAATTVAAAISLLATPVAAVELPRPAAAQAYDGEAGNAERHRRHGGRYGGWDDDIDAGDVVAGVVLFGVIAAITGAVRRANQQPVPQPVPYPDEDAGYRVPGAYQRNDSRGIDRAVDLCIGEIERGADRVGTVDAATRAADGWRVSGQLEGGAPYSCTIGNDGQIGDVSVGDAGVAAAPAGDGQWNDEAYAKARVDDDPGGDLGGDPAGNPGDDGRYETARAPDFE